MNSIELARRYYFLGKMVTTCYMGQMGEYSKLIFMTMTC